MWRVLERCGLAPQIRMLVEISAWLWDVGFVGFHADTVSILKTFSGLLQKATEPLSRATWSLNLYGFDRV